MPYDVRIVRSRDFVQLDAEGHFDMHASQRLFSDVMWACSRSQIGRVLVDVRDATAELTAGQLGTLASTCRAIIPPTDEHKIAMLTRAEVQFDRAVCLAEMAQNLGWNIVAFHEFEEAFRWLIS